MHAAKLLGRPVEVVHYDDGSRDAGTVAGFEKLMTKDQVDFLVGPYSSSLTLKASLVAEKYNTPMVSTAASAEEIWSRGLKNIFGADTPVDDYLEWSSRRRRCRRQNHRPGLCAHRIRRGVGGKFTQENGESWFTYRAG